MEVGERIRRLFGCQSCLFFDHTGHVSKFRVGGGGLGCVVVAVFLCMSISINRGRGVGGGYVGVGVVVFTLSRQVRRGCQRRH